MFVNECKTTLYKNKNNLCTFTNETICLKSMMVDQRTEAQGLNQKVPGW